MAEVAAGRFANLESSRWATHCNLLTLFVGARLFSCTSTNSLLRP